MLISEYVTIRWNSKNKRHYQELGYDFSKMGDDLVVKTKDLTPGSDVIVSVECDYCGTIYTKHYNHYLSESGELAKDACGNCKNIKASEIFERKYGVKNPFELDHIKSKIKKTNKSRYGTENPFSSEEIKNKIAETNIKKYGVKSFTQTDQYITKTAETCLKRYGVTNPGKIRSYRGALSPRWKGGVSYHRQERSTFEYNNWREQVYIRDGYTCMACGRRGGNLNAHHILNWKDNIDKRYDPYNGITLCDKCHSEFHKKYGRSNNTSQQMTTFIETKRYAEPPGIKPEEPQDNKPVG